MKNNKVAEIKDLRMTDLRPLYYTNCPDNEVFVSSIFQAIGKRKYKIKLLDNLPEKENAYGTFREIASGLSPDYFQKEAERNLRLHEKYQEYLSSH